MLWSRLFSQSWQCGIMSKVDEKRYNSIWGIFFVYKYKIRNVQKQLSEMMIMVRYWNQSFLQSRQCRLSSKVDSSSEIVWFLGEYISSIIKNHSHNHFRSPGSAGSLAKSMRSEMGESGSESGGVDGDNINVVIRWTWLWLWLWLWRGQHQCRY